MVGWRILLWAVLVLAVVLFLYLVRGILLPFILSFIIAALLEPSVRKLRLRGYSRLRSVTLVMAVFLLTMTAAGLYLVPRITEQIGTLTREVERFTRSVTTADQSQNFFVRWNPVIQPSIRTEASPIDRLLERYGPTMERFGLPSNRRAIVAQYIEPNRPQIARTVQGGFRSFFGLLTGLFSSLLLVIIVPILVPLILMDMENIRRRTPRWIPPTIRASTLAIVNDIGQVFIRYLRGIATVVLLFTVAVTALLIVMRVPYGPLMGLLFGALYIVPYIGNIISCFVLLCLIGFSDVSRGYIFGMADPWAYAVIVTALFLLVGWLFDHLIYPQMVGNAVGLNPVVSMFVIFCGGALFGLPGMLIAFPLAGAVKIVLDRLLRLTTTTGEALRLPSVPLRHRGKSAL